MVVYIVLFVDILFMCIFYVISCSLLFNDFVCLCLFVFLYVFSCFHKGSVCVLCISVCF